MRFSINALRIAANAAHEFPPNYERTRWHFRGGQSCPAHAMDLAGYGWRFQEMCELLWTAAGFPIIPDKWKRATAERYPEVSWFQTTLSDDPKMIAKMFDTILFCAGAIPACGAQEESEAVFQCA